MTDRYLARAIHFDESDQRIFHSPARTGEWCISGGFEFSNWEEGDLTGKARQAFANGWLGCETFGRVSCVAITKIEDTEYDVLVEALAAHFVAIYGAPSVEEAIPVASEELTQMVSLCTDQSANTLLTVSRELTETGVRETFRVVESPEANLMQFAVHGSLDEPPHEH
jgi:hypothetical protein